MRLQQVLDIKTDPAFWAHVENGYQQAAKDHSASWKSWARTRVRRGNRMETVNGASTLLGLTAGSVAAGGVEVSTAFVGASACVAGAVTLYAIPAVITAGAFCYWAYNKNQHHKVNARIWEFYSQNVNPNDGLSLQPGAIDTVAAEEIKEWFAWFGDEGLSNMNYLGPKLVEAQNAFNDAYRSVAEEIQKSVKEMLAATKMPAGTPVAAQQKTAAK